MLPTSPAVPSATPQRTDLRRHTSRVDERLRAIATIVEPATRAPERLVEAEPDYRTPAPRERGRLLLAAYEAASTDASQRLLIAEVMAHYRAHCLRSGFGDPFAEMVPARAVREAFVQGVGTWGLASSK